MITGEREIVGGGEEAAAKPDGNRVTQVDVNPAASNPWYRRISFWRSIAGMALAIALGCAAVALDTASELSSRSTFFHHRLELLRGRISELRTEAADAERHLAA